jgi:hypothetical protein
MALAMAAAHDHVRVVALLVALGACGRSGLGDVDAPVAPAPAGDAGVAGIAPPERAPPAADAAGEAPDATIDPTTTADADPPRICTADAGGTLLDTTGCAAREVVACVPFSGGTVQETLDDQIFMGNCQHRDGAGGFTVRFDAEGCAVEIFGGLFTACDIAWVSARRFACAESHPCATAPTLVK